MKLVDLALVLTPQIGSKLVVRQRLRARSREDVLLTTPQHPFYLTAEGLD